MKNCILLLMLCSSVMALSQARNDKFPKKSNQSKPQSNTQASSHKDSITASDVIKKNYKPVSNKSKDSKNENNIISNTPNSRNKSAAKMP